MVSLSVSPSVVSRCVTTREVYPNAPIVMAAVEVRHTAGEPLDAAGQRLLASELNRVLPLRHDPAAVGEIVVSPVGMGGVGPTVTSAAAEHRFSTRDRRTTAAFRDSSLTVQTTNYTRFEDLRDLLALVVEARSRTLGSIGVLRVGLRYIDEIRIPMENFNGNGEQADDTSSTPSPDLIGSGSPWSTWLHPSLLGPVDLAPTLDLSIAEAQGVMAFTRRAAAVEGAAVADEDNRVLVVRYGPREGYAVSSTPELRRPLPAPSPFFLLDIDSFREPANAAELSPDYIIKTVEDLHTPVREVFEGLITDRLREEVLRDH